MTKTSDIPSLPKDWKKFARELKAEGWTFAQKKRHVWAYAPDGTTTISLIGSASDARSLRNARAEFERWKRRRG
jgi:hypothetical protein